MTDRTCTECGQPISRGPHSLCHKCAWQQTSMARDSRARMGILAGLVASGEVTGGASMARVLGVSRQRGNVLYQRVVRAQQMVKESS